MPRLDKTYHRPVATQVLIAMMVRAVISIRFYIVFMIFLNELNFFITAYNL